jgi:hypothetical protein
MRHKRSILMGLLAGAAAVPAMAATGHYAISAQQVAAAISNMGVPTEPGQVALLSDVTANTASPHLRVESIQRWGTSGVMARLQCESQEECLPFFVRLHLQEGNQQPVLTSAPQPAAAPAQAKPAARTIMRAGSPAILMLDGPHVQIRVSVVCLDAGTLGQTVHATDPDHRQVYTAQVVADGLLKGRL